MFRTKVLGLCLLWGIACRGPAEPSAPIPSFEVVRSWPSTTDDAGSRRLADFGREGSVLLFFSEDQFDEYMSPYRRIVRFRPGEMEETLRCWDVSTVRMGASQSGTCRFGDGLALFEWTPDQLQIEPPTLPFGGPVVDCGDLNGDGLADLCTSYGVDHHPPDGVLDVEWSVGGFPHDDGRSIAVADLDRDGRAEVYQLVLRDGGHRLLESLSGEDVAAPEGRIVRVVPSPWDADLLVETEDAVLLLGPQGLEVLDFAGAGVPRGGDFDGDGELELAVLQQQGLAIFERDGTLLGRWEHPDRERYNPLDRDLRVGDFDGDGSDDLLLRGDSTVALVASPLASPQ